MCYRCNWSLKSISKAAGDIYELSYSTPDGDRTLRAKSVALTAPSYVVADLLKNVAPKASDVLRTIDYPPVCAVTIAYPESDIKVRLNPAFQVIQSYHTAGNTSVNLHPCLHVIKMRFSLPLLRVQPCLLVYTPVCLLLPVLHGALGVRGYGVRAPGRPG